MLTMHIAVVPFEDDLVDADDLIHVTAALQVQVARDLGPIWGISATVSPFFNLRQVPPGYWPLALGKEAPLGRRGLHFASGGRPFALVKRDDGWSRLASHELLELICDPWGNRITSGTSIRDEIAPKKYAAQGQVEYLVEVCDPCQRETYVINGVLVSDFVTPQYYNPFATHGARYSFTGAVKKPRRVLENGYLTWRDPETDEIWQAFGTDGDTEFAPLTGKMMPRDVSLREWVDDFGDERGVLQDLNPDEEPLAGARDKYKGARKSAKFYGDALRRDINRAFGIVDSRERGGGEAGAQQQLGGDGLVQLICELGQDDELRERYERNPGAVLAERGIDLAMDSDDIRLRSKEQFQAACARLTEPNRFGDPQDVPFSAAWWLATLGGG
jgi:hypothetical protein